jgi:hypothetical protein
VITGLVAVYYVFEQTPGRRGGTGQGAGAVHDADRAQQLGAGHDEGTGQDF